MLGGCARWEASAKDRAYPLPLPIIRHNNKRRGPPVKAPSKRGFGSTVVCDIAASSLHGQVELDFPVTGLSWRLQCPASEVVDGSDLTPIAEPENPADSEALKGSRPGVLVVEAQLIALSTSGTPKTSATSPGDHAW